MISVKNLYNKPKTKKMSHNIKKQIQHNIIVLKDHLEFSDIYGCEIKIKSSYGQSEWFIINDSQIIKLILSYEENLIKY